MCCWNGSESSSTSIFNKCMGRHHWWLICLVHTFFPNAWLVKNTNVFFRTHYHCSWRMSLECREDVVSTWQCLGPLLPYYKGQLKCFMHGWWIGRGGQLSWPPWPPDTNPLDFNLCGYIKGEVYAADIPNQEELWLRVEASMARVWNNPGVMERVQELIMRQTLYIYYKC